MVLEFIVYLSYPLPRFVLLPFFYFYFWLRVGVPGGLYQHGVFFPDHHQRRRRPGTYQ
jgi:hypothetical protein